MQAAIVEEETAHMIALGHAPPPPPTAAPAAAESGRPHVLLTGAAGTYGRILRTHWPADTFASVRLADRVPVDDAPSAEREAIPLRAHESFVEVDISDYASMLRACEGIDCVVHLAADPRPTNDHEQFMESLLPTNIVAAFNVYEAAVQAGCSRVVFASSAQAVLDYHPQEGTAQGAQELDPKFFASIDESSGVEGLQWDAPVSPLNLYGATKAWSEALGRVYSSQRGLSCICVRLCSPVDPAELTDGQADPETIQSWLGHGDAAELFERAVLAEHCPFAIIHGTSRHARNWLDLEHGEAAIGYSPSQGTAKL